MSKMLHQRLAEERNKKDQAEGAGCINLIIEEDPHNESGMRSYVALDSIS